MENMEKYIENLGWKKLAAIGIIFGVIMLAIVVLSINPQPAKTTEETAEPTPVETSNPGGGNPSMKNPASAATRLTYKNSFFTLQYPSTLRIAQSQSDDLGTSVMFAGPVRNQRIEIQVYDSAQTSVERISQVFAAFGYTKGTTVAAGYDASIFKGAIVGQPSALQETAIVFEKDEKTYKIQLTYTGSGDFEIEQEFANIVASIVLLN